MKKQHLRWRVTLFWGIILSIIFLSAILAPLLTPYGPNDVQLTKSYLPPNQEHFLGTDKLGRDVLTRLLFGGRISLSISLLSVTISSVLGIIIGGLSGYIGGWFDSIMMRLLDALLSIPNLIMIIALQAIFQGGLVSLIMIIGLTGWLPTARIVRSQFVELKEMQYVKSAILLGTSTPKIMIHHILRNSLSSLLVLFVFHCASALFVEVSLSFLGIGVPPHIPSWGNMMMDVQTDLFIGAWWIIIPVGLIIIATVLSINYLGEEIKKLTRTSF